MASGATFLESLSAEDRAALLATTHERKLATGDQLFGHGEDGSSFAILLAGRFKLVTRASTGRKVLLGLRGPGDLIGEIAILDQGLRTADVIALEPGRVAVGNSASLRRVLTERPSAMLAVCQSLNRRLREADEGRVEMAALTGSARVAVRLVVLAERYGRATDDGVEIALPVTQDEIADWTGLSRPAVARALAEFRAAGLVVTGRRSLTLTDAEGLRRYGERSAD